MVNKSYQSSEIGGGEDTHTGDPEYAKDFNSAYAKVRCPSKLILFSWSKRSIKSREILYWYLKMRSTR
jgi:hypothetical protein